MEKQMAWNYAKTNKPKDGRECNIEIRFEFNGKIQTGIMRNFIYSKNVFKSEEEEIEYSRFDENLISWQYQN